MTERRVLLVSGPAVGGMRRHVAALVTGLPAWEYELGLAAPPSLEIASPGPRFWIELGDRPRPPSDLSTLRDLRRVVREWRPAIVHAHGVKAALLTLSALPRGRPPVVVTFHNLWQGGPLTLPLRLLIRRAAAAVAVSAAVQERLEAHGIRPRRLDVIPNGIDLLAFPPSPPPPPGRPFTLLFAGRLTEEKGIPVLLEAVRRGTEGARWVVAGDGPLRSMVEAEAGRKGSPLEYRGAQREMMRLYHEADAVVIPSLSEGHPITALEAMACELPVIASRVGGLREIVIERETGCLVPPGDPEALAEAVRALAQDRERGRLLGTAGRRRVETEFSVERMLGRTAALYRAILGDETG